MALAISGGPKGHFCHRKCTASYSPPHAMDGRNPFRPLSEAESYDSFPNVNTVTNALVSLGFLEVLNV